VKFDESGNIQWQKTYGGTNDDRAYTIIPLSAGGYAVVGGTWSWLTAPDEWYGLWVWKLDDSGNLLWQKAFGMSGYSACRAIPAISSGRPRSAVPKWIRSMPLRRPRMAALW